jgi:hypothetical protein
LVTLPFEGAERENPLKQRQGCRRVSPPAGLSIVLVNAQAFGLGLIELLVILVVLGGMAAIGVVGLVVWLVRR